MNERGTLERLASVLKEVDKPVILPHNDPDPDALASAAALQHVLAHAFGIQSGISYKGIIGRAENRALMEYLGHEPDILDKAPATRSVILVDTQPGAGNNPVQKIDAVVATIDHHPRRRETRVVPFVDVRPQIGACATILTQYLQAAGLTPPKPLATALFYGIKSDTMALGRNVTADDVEAYVYLQGLVDPDALIEIEQAQVPAAYFRSINSTLEAAHVYGNVLIANVGAMAYPDLVAELADWLLRLKGVSWVICMGVYEQTLRVAVRTRRHNGGAGQLAQAIVGEDGIAGGHGTMAGGQIVLSGLTVTTAMARLRRRILNYFGIPADATGRRLMSLKRRE